MPSEVLARGDLLDWFVMDIAVQHEAYQQRAAEARHKGLPPPAADLPINTLQQMIDRVRK